MSTARVRSRDFDPSFRLLTDEDPATPHVEDARRWIDIYARLIDFKEHLLARVRSQGPAKPGPVEIDDRLAEVELTRLRSRLAFWQSRHRELGPLDVDELNGIIRADGHSVRLTKREAQLLRFLASHPNRFFDSRTLAAEAWSDSSLTAEQVRTYVVRVRRRLAEADAACGLRSERGRGYALFFPEAAQG